MKTMFRSRTWFESIIVHLKICQNNIVQFIIIQKDIIVCPFFLSIKYVQFLAFRSLDLFLVYTGTMSVSWFLLANTNAKYICPFIIMFQTFHSRCYVVHVSHYSLGANVDTSKSALLSLVRYNMNLILNMIISNKFYY